MTTDTKSSTTQAPPHNPVTGEVTADQSPTLAKLGEALAKAQGEMGAAKKDANNPYFNSRYADLAAVWDAIREPLAKNGLAVIQQVTTETLGTGLGRVTITSTLVHSSGEFIRDRCSLPVLPMSRKQRDGSEVSGPPIITPQAFGSAITYARRYSLSALVGVAAEEDDDGNAASAARSSGAKPPPTSRPSQAAVPAQGGQPSTAEMDAVVIKEHIEAAQTVKDLAALVDRINKLPESVKSGIRKVWGARRDALNAATNKAMAEMGVNA